jgi:GntR family transcriptional regulator / MocR family aminotransferase
MVEGHFARHLKRMRGLYGTRRAALAEALGEVFGNRLQISLRSGGMHLLARHSPDIPDTKLVRLAERRGLAPAALFAHMLVAECAPGLLLSFTNVPECRAQGIAQDLLQAIGNYVK